MLQIINIQPKYKTRVILAAVLFLAACAGGAGVYIYQRYFAGYYDSDSADRLAESGVAQWLFDPADPLLSNREILITYQINEITVKELVYKLYYLDANGSRPINLYLMTTGGWLDAAFAIIDAMHSIKAPVNTIAIGGCSSAGAMILAAGTGKRRAFSNTVIMVHSTLGKSKKPFSSDVADRERVVRFWQSAARLPKEWFPFIREKEYFLSAAQAFEYGIIDEVIESEIGSNRK